MARVNIEDSTWNDIRFEILGNLLGEDNLCAIGRVARIWAYCTDRQKHTISNHEIEVLGKKCNLASKLVECGLAIKRKNDSFYIKGTIGRIEWLASLRNSSRKGGEATKAKWLGQSASQKASKKASQKHSRTLGAHSLSLSLTNKENIYKRKKSLFPNLIDLWNQNCGILPKL